MHRPPDHSTDTGQSLRPCPQGATVLVELERDRIFRAAQLDRLGSDVDEARAAGDDARAHVARLLAAAAKTALVEIDAALERLDRGTYGTCESCDEPIRADRLAVLPVSRLCTPCKSRNEARPRGVGRAVHSTSSVGSGRGRNS